MADPRFTDIFRNQDLVRLRRTLTEQFCYILGGGCDYTGRDMAAAHKDMGIQQADHGRAGREPPARPCGASTWRSRRRTACWRSSPPMHRAIVGR